MFFTYADKQGSIFSDAWQVRQVAFDTLRRYLYYSAPLKDGRVLTPIDTELTPATAHAAATTTSAHACATTSSNAQLSSSAAAAAGTSSSLPSAGRRNSGHISTHTATLRHSSTTDVTTLVPAVVAASTTPRTSAAAAAAAPPSSPSTAHSNSSSGTFVAAAATAAPPRSPASPRPDHATAASWPHHASPPRPSPHSLQTATTTTMTTTQPSADVCGPHEVTWKKKIKVDALVLVTKEHHFSLDDVHLCEQDFFQVEVYGDTRPLALGESPSPGPLLCASAGLDGLPARCTVSNDDYLHDRFFLRELYESLRDQFVNLRIERERVDLAAAAAAAAAAGGGAASGGSGGSGSGGAQPPQREEEWRQPPRLRTLQSPRKKGAPLQMGSRVKIVLRLRNEYEFRRFTYVVLTVLGYDKLCSRPFRGLPPYDPRNGLVFAQIPMCVWQSFRALDRAVFYTFLRCDVVGRGSDGDLTIYLRGGYLCITHDAVLVLRDAGHVPRWVRLVDVHTFCYNASCHRPYMAFLSDGLAVDLVVLPQHPVYGPEAIRHFSAAAETLRVRHVMHEISFASLDIRRVVRLVEVADASVRAFVTRHEQESGTRLKLEPLTDTNSSGNTNNSGGAAVLSATDSGSSGHRVLRRGSSSNSNNDIDYTRLAGPMGLYYANTSLLQQPSRHHHHHQQQRTPRDEGGGSGGNGPLPQEQLAQVWRDVQHIYASRDPLLVSQAAIPLYENNTNDAHLTRDQLDALERLMSRERASEEDIVGMSYEEIQQVELQHAADALRQRARERRHGERHGRTQQRRRHSASHHRRRHRRHHDNDDDDNNDDDSRTHASRHRSRTATSTSSQRPSSPQAATRTHDSAARHSSAAGGAAAVHVYHQRQHRRGDERDGSRSSSNSSNNSRHRRPRDRHSHTHRQQPQQDDHGEARAEGARTHAAVTATARLQSSPSPLSRGRTRPPLPSLSPLASPEEAALPCRTAARHRTSATTAAGGEAAAAAATAGDGGAGSEAVATSPSRSRGADDATSEVGNYSLRDSSRGSNSSSVSSSRRRHRQRRSDSSATVSSSSSSSSSSAPSDYVVPGSRYITRDELAQQLDTQQQQPCLPQLLQTPLPLPVIEEHHVVLSSQSPASSTRSHSPPPPLQQQQQNADKSNDATSSHSNTQRQQQQEQQPHDDSAHAQRHERHTGMHVTSSSSSSRNNNDRGGSGRGGLRSSNHFAASEPNVSVMAERNGDTQRARGSARTRRDSCPQAGGSGGGGGGGNASVRAQRSTA